MDYCYFFLFFCLLNSLLDVRVSGCDVNCADTPIFSLSRLVVRHGDPASVTCVACQKNCTEEDVGLETSVGNAVQNGTTLSWTVKSMTEWSVKMLCYYRTTDVEQCCTKLPVTVYQPPDNVSISLAGHAGPMRESSQYTLQCDVQNAAPLRNLTVTFYKGQTVLDRQQSTKTIIEEKKPADEQFTWDFTASKEDNGIQFWCEAELELGPDGPQIPPVVKSGKLTATIHYGPELKQSANPDTITIIKGETLHLDCSAEGNPVPSYNWTLPSGDSSYSGSVLTIESVGFDHGGQYVCTVGNSVKSVQLNFTVAVQVNPLYYIIPIVISLAVLLAVIVIIGYRHCYKQKRMDHILER
ncbi:cell adhesion molecule Dscam2-like isoform X2 [Cololabis saira]|uniref:cell adhesion molecule Dscam2-like isoform X2 n=1 Tax=Cololabis saira TaxID=129043 RepID=UPI002AD3FF08|nr:cell adhesion molecule Dscam2-like isoform X2 [Cololabis saira]